MNWSNKLNTHISVHPHSVSPDSLSPMTPILYRFRKLISRKTEALISLCNYAETATKTHIHTFLLSHTHTHTHTHTVALRTLADFFPWTPAFPFLIITASPHAITHTLLTNPLLPTLFRPLCQFLLTKALLSDSWLAFPAALTSILIVWLPLALCKMSDSAPCSELTLLPAPPDPDFTRFIIFFLTTFLLIK